MDPRPFLTASVPLADVVALDGQAPGTETVRGHPTRDDEVNVDASGVLIEALTSRYPGGWSGGDLPARGFWGRPDVPADIVEFVSAFLRSIATQS